MIFDALTYTVLCASLILTVITLRLAVLDY